MLAVSGFHLCFSKEINKRSIREETDLVANSLAGIVRKVVDRVTRLTLVEFLGEISVHTQRVIYFNEFLVVLVCGFLEGEDLAVILAVVFRSYLVDDIF